MIDERLCSFQLAQRRPSQPVCVFRCSVILLVGAVVCLLRPTSLAFALLLIFVGWSDDLRGDLCW